MAYCYECGEKVAEIDVFCPFCGISIKPAALGDDDASTDKTVAISGGDLAELSEKSAVSSVETPKSAEIPAPLPETPPPTDESADYKTEENLNMKTKSVEIPAEVLAEEIAPQSSVSEIEEEKIEEIGSPNDDLPEPSHIEILKPIVDEAEMSEAATSEEKPAEEIVSEEAENVEIVNFDAPETPSESLEEIAPVDDLAEYGFIDETEPKAETIETIEDISDAETLQTVDDPAIIEPLLESVSETEPDETAEDADFVATMIHPSQRLEKLSGGLDISQFDAPPVEEVEEAEAVEEIQNLQAEAVETPLEEEAISKPEEHLEEPKTPPVESVFDSVQIVQTTEKETDFEEKVAQAEAANASGETDAKDKESRSYTTPNIGAEHTDGKKAAKLKPLDEGTVLNNRYEIVRKIGGGGMGAVYLASDKNLGGVLRAVKEMVQSYIEEIQQDKAIADFKRESMLLTSLEHAAIPTIYDYFFEEKEMRFYLVMKYISGGDLAGRLRAAAEGKIDEQNVTEWAIQISDVLDYLHNHEPAIVYRDLKPANIMIDGKSGRLMLIDFGIARWINKEEKGVTAVGTMGYAPPELFSGNVEPRSDIYSLGSTMFHLLTGADPQSNPLLIFDFQKNPRPRQINSALSDQMERILMQSVEYTADKRFASAAELKKTLEEHLENLKSGKVTYGIKEAPASVSLTDQLVFCGFCGQKIVASDVFCAFCGSQQPIANQQQSAAFSVAPTTAKLTLLTTGEFDSTVFSLDKESNIVGRRDPMSNIFPEVDLSKFDPQTKISRRHARIWREGNNFMVEDLGSSNGTILMPAVHDTMRLLPHQPQVLTNGDKIKVGDTTMSFMVG